MEEERWVDFYFQASSRCSFQSISQKEQQWAKMRFHPKPIWSDQTANLSGRRGHTHQQMLWLLVELPTSRHEPWLTASWWLNGYTSLPSLACKTGFMPSGYFQFFPRCPNSKTSIRYQSCVLCSLNSRFLSLVLEEMGIFWACQHDQHVCPLGLQLMTIYLID